MNTGLDKLGQLNATLIDVAIRFGPKVLVAILMMVSGFLVAKWVGRTAQKALQRFDLEPPVRLLLVRFARVLVLALFAMMALQNLGIELLPLIAGLGVVGEILHNYGRIRQVEVLVGVAYGTDLSMALAAVRDVVQANARVLAEPLAVVQVVELADSAMQIAVKPWVAVTDFVAVVGELNMAVVEELERRRIGIPAPRRDVHLIGAVRGEAA